MANPATMFHAYIGELRGGRIKITTDRDCLSPELIRCDERVFATEEDLLHCANTYRGRGYSVCVDTENIFQDYLPEQVTAEVSETLARVFTVSKYRAAWHKLGILEFTLETIASRIFQSFQREEIDFDTMSHACDSIEKVESLHAQELGLA